MKDRIQDRVDELADTARRQWRKNKPRTFAFAAVGAVLLLGLLGSCGRALFG